MRKRLSVILILIILLSLCSCGSSVTNENNPARTYDGSLDSHDTPLHAPFDSSQVSEMDYTQAESLLQKAGFVNITLSAIDDINSDSTISDGSVEKITINGRDDYRSDDTFPYESEIVIFYHNIPKIAAPISSNEAQTKPYMEIGEAFSDSGFVHIETDEIYDLPINTDSQTVLLANDQVIGDKSFLPFDTNVTVIQHFPVPKYSVSLNIDFLSNLIFSKYDVAVALNGKNLGTLAHGKDATYNMSLEAGDYTLSFTNTSNKDVSGSISFTVSSDVDALYSISCYSDEVNVKKKRFSSALQSGQVMMPFSSNHYLRKDYSDVVNELTELGFSQIATVTTTESYWPIDGINSVVKILVDNQSTFSQGKIVDANRPVTVYYHIPSFRFNQTSISITENEDFELPYTLSSDDRIENITFMIDHPEVVQRNQDGSYTALAPGHATVSAFGGGHTFSTCSITVNEIIVPINNISFPQNEITVSVGSSFSIDYEVKPENANYRDISVLVSNELLETTKKGNEYTFYSNEEGDSEVSFYQDDHLLGTCVVHAQFVEVEDISLEAAPNEVLMRHTIDLPFTLIPENATNKGITFVSSDPNILEVEFDERGKSIAKITGKSVGEATVKITTTDGKEFSCDIVVKEIDPTRITVTNVNPKETIRVGTPIHLNVAWVPRNTTDKDLTWSSSDNNVIKINSDGSFEAVGIGTVEITATHKTGLSRSITLTVEPTPVTSIDIGIDRAIPAKLYAGDSFTIDASVSPSDATDKTLTFISEDESIVKVSDNGKVTAVGPGTTNITISSSNGITRTYPVTISQAPQKFRINYSAYRVSNDHVGNNWSTYFYVNGGSGYNGYTLTLEPGDSFTVSFLAEENDSSPDSGDYYESFTYTDDLCKYGYSCTEDIYVREDRGRYAGNYAVWRFSLTITPIR